jgi:hypothetical protein
MIPQLKTTTRSSAASQFPKAATTTLPREPSHCRRLPFPYWRRERMGSCQKGYNRVHIWCLLPAVCRSESTPGCSSRCRLRVPQGWCAVLFVSPRCSYMMGYLEWRERVSGTVEQKRKYSRRRNSASGRRIPGIPPSYFSR